MGKQVSWYFIDHDHNINAFEVYLYHLYGTHLSDLGNQILINNLQVALQTFITNKGNLYSPAHTGS